MSLSKVYTISDLQTIYLSKEDDSEIKDYLNSRKYKDSQDQDTTSFDKHIADNYTEYTIKGLSDYKKLYVHQSLITKGDVESVTGTINIEEANTLLGCHKIESEDKGVVTMSENASCSVMGGRKSRKQRRSKRRRRRGRQSRK
jgi:hypothetical protein